MNQGKSKYPWKEECLSFIQNQTYTNQMQIMPMHIDEVNGKNLISHRFQKERNSRGSGKVGLKKFRSRTLDW